MKRCILPLAVCCSGVLLTTRAFSLAEVATEAAAPNPYLAIVERNPFNLKPPPPPPTNAPTPEITAAAKVILTGIHSIIGPTAALLEIEDTEPGAKTKTVRKPILREGERDGSVEVISIDIKNNVVRIRNGPTETELTFQKPNPAGGPPAPGAPPGMAGMAPPPPTPPPLGNPSGVTAAAANHAPIVVSRDPSNPGTSGVHMYGGSAAAVSPASASVSPASSSVTSYGGSGGSYNRSGSLASTSGRTTLLGGVGTDVGGTGNSAGNGLPMNRPVRDYPTVSKEQAWASVEKARAAAIAAGDPSVAIIPPTPYTRDLYQGQRPELLIQPNPNQAPNPGE